MTTKKLTNNLGINYHDITTIAYTELLHQGVCGIPVDPLKFKFDDGIIVTSLQRYCRMVDSAIELATCGGFFDDGYAVKELRPGLNLILYNQEKYDPRMRFTILHEIGHIRLGHKKHGPVEENEADFFAAQLLAPNVLIREIALRKYPISKECLMSTFWISGKCAERKLRFLSEYPAAVQNELDGKILTLFNKYLIFNLPQKCSAKIQIEYEP